MRRGLWIGLFLLALAVRIVGLDFDQGHFYHPDERAIGDAILKISFRPLALNPHFFAYGSFPLYVDEGRVRRRSRPSRGARGSRPTTG